MKKLLFTAAIAALTIGAFADPAAELAATVAEPAVQAEFDQPDGAAFKLLPDGSFQIFARGTGTYDFDDVDDVNDAKKEAVLKAKAAIAKFMKEKLSTEEGLSEASKKTKTATSDGENQSVSVSKESVKVSSTTIQNQASELLKGVITLKMQKIARKGSTGEIQATVGVSSKSIKVANQAHGEINKPSSPVATPVKPKPNGGPGGNSSWKQDSDSDF